MRIRASFAGFAPDIEMKFNVPRGRDPAAYADSILKMLIAEEFQPEMTWEEVEKTEVRPLKKEARPAKKQSRRGRPAVKAEDIPVSFRRLYQDFLIGNINLTELSLLAKVSRPTVYRYIKMLELEALIHDT